MRYGYVKDVVNPEDYFFGGAPRGYLELQSDGQWDEFLPVVEIQRQNGLETSNCTVYGNTNAIEILHKRLFIDELNYSERYVGVMAETTPAGNSPHKVLEVIRKTSGLVLDEVLPFSSDINEWDEYYSPKPMRTKYIRMGQCWLKEYKLKHEYVFTGGAIDQKQKLLMNSLKSSPIGVSVYAWEDEGGVYVKPSGAQDNHWCVLYGYVENEYWKIFDHYDDTHKKLAWDYDFGVAKMYRLEKLEQVNWLSEILSSIALFLRDLFVHKKG